MTSRGRAAVCCGAGGLLPQTDPDDSTADGGEAMAQTTGQPIVSGCPTCSYHLNKAVIPPGPARRAVRRCGDWALSTDLPALRTSQAIAITRRILGIRGFLGDFIDMCVGGCIKLVLRLLRPFSIWWFTPYCHLLLRRSSDPEQPRRRASEWSIWHLSSRCVPGLPRHDRPDLQRLASSSKQPFAVKLLHRELAPATSACQSCGKTAVLSSLRRYGFAGGSVVWARWLTVSGSGATGRRDAAGAAFSWSSAGAGGGHCDGGTGARAR